VIPDDVVLSVVQAILEAGYKLGSETCPLMWAWHGKKYWGAAHGMVGILYLLISDEIYKNFIEPNSKWKSDIQLTIEYILSKLDKDGSFSSRLGGSNDLVQWCHGPPGFIFLMCRAHEIYGDEKFIVAAKKAAQVTWEKGFLSKGASLCHGVAGNAYALLCVYRATNEVKYVHQALQYALAFPQEKYQKLMVKPDRPYSLYGGLSAIVPLYVDLLVNPKDARFPAYEDLT